jgi:hypothetical protein
LALIDSYAFKFFSDHHGSSARKLPIGLKDISFAWEASKILTLKNLVDMPHHVGRRDWVIG